MDFNLKNSFFGLTLLAALLFSTSATAQSSCCTKGKEAKAQAACCTKGKDAKDKTACCATAAKAEAGKTSGCSPSACRGAQTKFGEAKVITNLRLNLIELKTGMEKSTSPKFDATAYDIHGIVGESDEESLAIIIKEVKLVETVFAEKLKHQATAFVLPDNKAKQVKYLNARIDRLKDLL